MAISWRLLTSYCLFALWSAQCRAHETPTNALKAANVGDREIVVRCEVVEISVDSVPAELRDQFLPDTGMLRLFEDQTTGLRSACTPAVQKLIDQLIKAGVAQVVAKPTVTTRVGCRQEVHHTTIVPAALNPLQRNIIYDRCRLSATPQWCRGIWVVAFELNLLEPDYFSPTLVLPPPFPGGVVREQPIQIPCSTCRGMQTTFSLPAEHTGCIGGLFISQTETLDDGSTKIERIATLVLLTVEGRGPDESAEESQGTSVEVDLPIEAELVFEAELVR